MKAEEIRELLPEEVRGSFDGIVNQTILGASAHIRLIGDMIEAIARQGEAQGSAPEQTVADIKAVASFFIETRGKASRAVRNAILLMVHGIDGCASLSPAEAAEQIVSTKNAYAVGAAEATERCVAYAAQLAEKMDRVFVFDYSSTVDRFLARLADGGKRTVVVPESRVIDGGRPFLKTCIESGHAVRFVPDAAMLDALRGCDAAFMGAETFYPDGTGFNTLGSDIVGVLCEHLGIPLYFITPMVKLDTRPVFGGSKQIVFDDLREKLSAPWDGAVDASGIDFVVPELVGVPASQIRAFITEQGVIPSGQMFEPSMRYAAYLSDGECGWQEEG